MPSKYISTGKKVQEELDSLFDKINEMSISHLNLHMLRRVGANEQTVYKVIQIYEKAGELEVNLVEETVRKK